MEEENIYLASFDLVYNPINENFGNTQRKHISRIIKATSESEAKVKLSKKLSSTTNELIISIDFYTLDISQIII